MQSCSAILPFILLAAACGSPAPVSEVPQAPAGEILAQPKEPARPTAPPTEAPAFTVKGTVSATLTGEAHNVTVELVAVDEAGRPAEGIEIQGRFIEGLKDRVVLITDERGVATATATGGATHMSVGFAVDAVVKVSGQLRTPGKAITDVIYPSPCCPFTTPPTM